VEFFAANIRNPHRHLFNWLVTGQVVPANPASSVRGPSHSPKIGRTAVLAPEEARALLGRIEITTPLGLRDRALIALMVYSFARIGAALAMKVEDVFVQNRRLWVRLREKGGKPHAMPCHHNLETYLNAYIGGAGIADDPKGPLFRTIGRGTGLQDRRPGDGGRLLREETMCPRANHSQLPMLHLRVGLCQLFTQPSTDQWR
jgi:integrase/recombinase XerC